MRFLIASAPRSGTKYAAEVFTAVGLDCGHEHVFNLAGMSEWTDRPGESSWLSAPHLTNLPEDVLVFHQRRDRMLTALSIVRHGFFSEGDAFRAWAEQWVQAGGGDPLDRAFLFQQGWHALIGQQLRNRLHVSYRVETLPGILRGLCRLLDHRPTKRQMQAALAVPQTVNTNRQEL